MAASLPPSSSVTRLRSAADEIATFLPALTEPVNVTLRGVGCAVIAAPRSSPPVTTLSTPGGSTSLASSPSRSVANGVKGDGLSTIVLPARSAGAIFHIARPRGKFHGVIAATTPSGRWATSINARSSSCTTSRGIIRSA